MDTPSDRLAYEIGGLPLDELTEGGATRGRFLEVQAPWTARGTARWLKLVDPRGGWPIRVWGARRRADATLLGTLVAVWAPQPLDRFDDLLESTCPTGDGATARPTAGTWHFIAVTRHPDGAALGLGRALVKHALSVIAREHAQAQARTLSPAVGLPEAAAAVGQGLGFSATSVARTLRQATDAEGRPCLKVLRLHLGAGASLDAALWASRADDTQSGAVTLRFAYDPDQDRQEAQKQHYQRWVADRRAAIDAGGARPIAGDDSLWLHPAATIDGQFMGVPLFPGQGV
jgi:hypothetical protein